MYDVNSAMLHTRVQIRWEAVQCEEKLSRLLVAPEMPRSNWFGWLLYNLGEALILVGQALIDEKHSLTYQGPVVDSSQPDVCPRSG